MIWAGIKMLLALGGIIALLFLSRGFLKKMEMARRNLGPDTGIKLLSSKMIAPQKYVSLVEIGGEVLALGISAQQITFLTKIENKESVKRDLPDPAVRPEALFWLRHWPLWQKIIKSGGLRMEHEK